MKVLNVARHVGVFLLAFTVTATARGMGQDSLHSLLFFGARGPATTLLIPASALAGARACVQNLTLVADQPAQVKLVTGTGTLCGTGQASLSVLRTVTASGVDLGVHLAPPGQDVCVVNTTAGASVKGDGVWAYVPAPVNVPPTAALSSPAYGSQLSLAAGPVVLTATATDPDGTIDHVDFLVNGAVVGTATVAPYASSWTPAAVGPYSLAVMATDAQGAVGFSGVIAVTVVAHLGSTRTH